MTRRKTRRTVPSVEPPKIHEATRASGPSGVVFKGAEIDLATAIARRKSDLDTVVCGADVDKNRGLARTVESSIGPCIRQEPHWKAGPFALPHFQQETPPPVGHA